MISRHIITFNVCYCNRFDVRAYNLSAHIVCAEFDETGGNLQTNKDDVLVHVNLYGLIYCQKMVPTS